MVGVPRSTGCPICVKRRIKCDQTTPSCANCRRYGVECPGYGRVVKFVGGSKHIRGTGNVNTSREITREGSIRDLKPNNLRQQYTINIISSLQKSNSADEISIFAPWFEGVPRRLFAGGESEGYGSKALDAAMTAFATHLMGKAEKSAVLVAESRSVYGMAVVALQRALDCGIWSRRSETLCAAMILTLFELFAGTNNSESTPDPSSWMKHAVGVSYLIQQRGPGGYQDSWDREMLFSFRVVIIMNSMFSGTPCFLSQKKWQRVLLLDDFAPQVLASHRATPSIARVHNRFLAHLARLPGLIRTGLALREAKRQCQPIDPTTLSTLIQETLTLHSDFTKWFTDYESLDSVSPPIEIPSKDPASIFSSAMYFPTGVWYGSLYMGYWTSMFILGEILGVCGCQIPSTGERREVLLDRIWKSVETVGRGYMGPYRVGYAVRITFEFADLKTKRYLFGVLKRSMVHYAASSPVEEGYGLGYGFEEEEGEAVTYREVG